MVRGWATLFPLDTPLLRSSNPPVPHPLILLPFYTLSSTRMHAHRRVLENSPRPRRRFVRQLRRLRGLRNFPSEEVIHRDGNDAGESDFCLLYRELRVSDLALSDSRLQIAGLNDDFT